MDNMEVSRRPITQRKGSRVPLWTVCLKPDVSSEDSAFTAGTSAGNFTFAHTPTSLAAI